MRNKPTDAERRLWSILRNKRLAEHKFKRQQVIGPYIVDFINFEQRLIIEADGSQHIDNEADQRRTAWLEAQSFRVLRFFNDDILARTEPVADAIWHALTEGHPPLPPTATRRAPPSPAREEGMEGGAHA
jgi:very-short-patch-repair endonuclease